MLGGYGAFGRLVVASLARHEEISVVVAGRSIEKARALCRSLVVPNVAPLALDCSAPDLGARLGELRPTVVIDTAGPFQSRDYAVARACLAAGAHYVDLADGREYVAGIGALNEAARARGRLIVSGASTCPALSTAVADELSRDLARVDEMSLGIAPGHRVPRGIATARSVLGYCGQRIPSLRDGAALITWGWSGLTRHAYPAPVGPRWLSRVDVPEGALWPSRYPGLRELELRAGLEIGVLHVGLTALSQLARLQVIGSLARHAGLMLRVSSWFDRWGHPIGAMHVAVTGATSSGSRLRRTWSIVATGGDGPQIPAAPAALIAKKLLGVAGYAAIAETGARPCMGLFSLAEMLAELERFAIRTELDEKPISL